MPIEPNVTNLSPYPAYGPRAGGTNLTMSGTHFAECGGAAAVYYVSDTSSYSSYAITDR